MSVLIDILLCLIDGRYSAPARLAERWRGCVSGLITGNPEVLLRKQVSQIAFQSHTRRRPYCASTWMFRERTSQMIINCREIRLNSKKRRGDVGANGANPVLIRSVPIRITFGLPTVHPESGLSREFFSFSQRTDLLNSRPPWHNPRRP